MTRPRIELLRRRLVHDTRLIPTPADTGRLQTMRELFPSQLGLRKGSLRARPGRRISWCTALHEGSVDTKGDQLGHGLALGPAGGAGLRGAEVTRLMVRPLATALIYEAEMDLALVILVPCGALGQMPRRGP